MEVEHSASNHPCNESSEKNTTPHKGAAQSGIAKVATTLGLTNFTTGLRGPWL
jgi:hypothetical protein